MTFNTLREAKEAIQASIDSNDAAVRKALLMIYTKQTASEQASYQTVEANGVGFSGCDAKILTSFAQQFQRRGLLTPKQMSIARENIRRYWKQLAVMSGVLVA